MKKVLFSVLMLSAMFMIASCGSKSNSGEATSEEANSEEAATPKCEPADPPFTYKEFVAPSHWEENWENVPLDGCFEIQKVAVAKTTNENRDSEYSYKIMVTVNLKMIKDYPNKVNYIVGNIQLLNKDGAVLADLGTERLEDALGSLKVGGIGVISDYKLAEYDADGLVNDIKYIRITEFSAGHKIIE